MEQFDADHKIKWKIRKIKGIFRIARTYLSEFWENVAIEYRI